jgi:hypothetical protein
MSLGKKPVSGGIPLIDKIMIGMRIFMNLYELQAFCNWGCVVIDMMYIRMNIGAMMVEYMMK